MSIQNYMACLSTEQLMSLHSDLVLAGIAFDGKGDYRAIFARGRENSTGKLKKIYAALFKAKKENINEMVRTLVELLPQGVKTNANVLNTKNICINEDL